jgi:hypothetical protein
MSTDQLRAVLIVHRNMPNVVVLVWYLIALKIACKDQSLRKADTVKTQQYSGLAELA